MLIAAASLFGRWRVVTQTALQRPTIPKSPGNQGKHRVTKRRVTLTLVTSVNEEDPTKNKVKEETEEEAMTRGDQPCVSDGKEEIPGDVSTDGSRRRNPPERCPRPLYPQDCPEENHNIPEDHQGEDLIDIKVEVIHGAQEAIAIWADQQDGSRRRNPPERCPRPLCPQDCPEENHNIPEEHQLVLLFPMLLELLLLVLLLAFDYVLDQLLHFV
ncbi:unnamed protein product [Ranitomeya imitator]|uniref:Uncharacterized protein n=1 Tax=Ranitomeya imitator TaxID=111125 RepID=A0ABN9LRS3_9NEOB|nr:unnamed protein product [Ranitomeya imitator]